MNYIARHALLLVAFFALAACGNNAAPQYTLVIPASLTPGDAIPAPSGAPVLTLSGAIGVTNVGDTLAFDVATLDRLGVVQYTVDDPWLKTTAAYSGVLMSDLLNIVKFHPYATVVHITALDDYQVDIPIADIQRWPIMLATHAGGRLIGVADNGPTRIIFPYHAYPEIDPMRYNDLWIWSIKSMEVR